MIGDLLGRRSIGAAEVDLICALNKDHELDQERHRLSLSPTEADRVTHAAALACLGSAEGRARVLQALTSDDDAEVQIAEVYLGHRPITDVDELRVVASGIARMTGSARAGSRARHPGAPSPERSPEPGRAGAPLSRLPVRRRAAGHRRGLHPRRLSDCCQDPKWSRVLSQYRLKSPDGDDIIDILIRRLRAS